MELDETMVRENIRTQAERDKYFKQLDLFKKAALVSHHLLRNVHKHPTLSG